MPAVLALNHEIAIALGRADEGAVSMSGIFKLEPPTELRRWNGSPSCEFSLQNLPIHAKKIPANVRSE